MKNLEELAEELTAQDIQELSYLKGNGRMSEEQKRIETQVPEDVIRQYSENQYVEAQVEVVPGVECLFRTIPPFALDDAMSKARRADLQTRALGRRKLAFGLMKINGDIIPGADPIEGSYYTYLSSGQGIQALRDKIIANADVREKFLEFHGLTDKIAEAFGMFETICFNRINGIDDLGVAVKNSTKE